MLLDSTTHITFIDSLVEPALKDKYAECFERYNKLDKEINTIKNNRQQILREKDMLEYQLNEVESMAINIEVDSQIDDKVGILSNMEKILENSARSLDMLRDGEMNAYDLLSSASGALSAIADYSEDLANASGLLTEATYLLNDAIAGIEKVADRQDLDPAELDSLMDRKYKLSSLMQKYGPTLEDVLTFAEETSKKLDDINFGQDNLDKLEKTARRDLYRAERGCKTAEYEQG